MNKFKILSIEDAKEISKLIELTLRDTYEVYIAHNGENGIEIWEREKPDLILLDVMLPDMSGLEICGYMRGRKEFKDDPVIFISSAGTTPTKVTGYNLGAINFLDKPFHRDELLSIISSTLERFHPRFKSQLSFAGVSLDTHKDSLFYNNKEITLTRNESILMAYFLTHPDRITTRETLKDVLGKSDLSPRTVDSYLSKLKKKLEETPLKFSNIYGEGYKLTS